MDASSGRQITQCGVLFFLAVLALAVAVSMPVAASAGSGQHAAITITANSDFTAPGSPTGCACVTAGNGTPASRYVIGPWAITAPSEGSSGWAVKVDNTSGAITRSFAISRRLRSGQRLERDPGQ